MDEQKELLKEIRDILDDIRVLMLHMDAYQAFRKYNIRSMYIESPEKYITRVRELLFIESEQHKLYRLEKEAEEASFCSSGL